MKILYITHYGELYGANYSLLNLIIRLKKEYNIEPFVLVNEYGKFVEKLNEYEIPVIMGKYSKCTVYIKRKHLAIKKVIKKVLRPVQYQILERKLNKYGPFDLIHSNSSVIDVGYYIAKRWNVKHIWHVREYGESDYDLIQIDTRRIIRKKYLEAAQVIAISNSISEMLQIIDQKINVVTVYNGIVMQSKYTKKYLNNGRIHFCIVGFISENKNQMEAVQAVQVLVNLNVRNFMLHIVGDGREDTVDMINQYISQNCLNDYVRMEGYINNISEFLDGMDVGIVTSQKEAFGRVTIEYMNNYMPVIGKNTGGTKELILEGINGYLYKEDAFELASKMRLFLNDTEKMVTMGKQARNFSEKFTAEKNAEEILNVYMNVLNS